jgi:sugar phosphate isomerase/epimerase
VPEDFPRDEAWNQLVEFVSLAGQIAGTHGITIAIEPLNTKESNIINSVAEALELARAADHPFVRVLADLYHMQEENEPLEHIVDAGAYLVHTHTADTGRFYPGSGSYPNREFLERLYAVDYNGRMSVECRWNDFEAECKKALEFLGGIDRELA